MPFRDLIAGLLMVVLAIALFAGTFGFSDVSGYVSPRFFPRVVSGALMAFSLVLLGRAIRSFMQQGWAASGGPTRWPAMSDISRDWRRLGLLVAISAAYVTTIDTLGYILATTVFLAVTVRLYGDRRWWLIAAVALAGAFGLYGTFRMVFDVPLPRFDLF
jgi:putative tricarboxylic transport membrane protein